MSLFKVVEGKRNAFNLGFHSCLMGFQAVGFRYVIYIPERFVGTYCPVIVEKLIDVASRFSSRRPPDLMPIIGFGGFSFGVMRQERIVSCDIVLGPSIMPSHVFARIAASRGVNERPWELSDELAVSLLAGGVKVKKSRRCAIDDPSMQIDSDIDVSGWKELSDKIRRAGG